MDCENNTPHTTAMEHINIPIHGLIISAHCIEKESGKHMRSKTLTTVDEKCIKAIHAAIDAKKLTKMHVLV